MKKCQNKKEKLEYIMRKKTALAFYFAAAVTAGLVGCSTPSKDPAYDKADTLPEYQQNSFQEYIADTKTWLTENRLFLTGNQHKLSLIHI